MKKIIPIILLLVISVNGFSQKKKMTKDSIISIAFTIAGRRGKDEVEITKTMATCTNRSGKKFIQMSTASWNELTTALKGLKLPKLNSLPAPTNRRQVDGARHCQFIISTRNAKYESQFFDSGSPMKSLKVLYDKVDAIRNVINDSGAEWKE
jgi:hypothetical protein